MNTSIRAECGDSLAAADFDSWGKALAQRYGGMGCRLVMSSPDNEYLAYLTIMQTSDESGKYYAEALKVKQIFSPASAKQVHVAHRMNSIGRLEWEPSGKLIFWESIWEGPGVTFVYDPATDRTLAMMAADENTAWEWNPQHSAFYAARIGGYGADNCVGELNGYDFTSDSSFPDLRKLFGVGRATDDPFVPQEMADDLLIAPFHWSQDGNRLWLTVTPLHWLGDEIYQFELGPRQAGVVELLPNGTRYVSLAQNPGLDYSFDASPEPKLISQPHQPVRCPP
jgi:hypothetical protein